MHTPHPLPEWNALARLGDNARTVVWLHDVEGYTHAEIAERHGVGVVGGVLWVIENGQSRHA